jgi:hypothetical protein
MNIKYNQTQTLKFINMNHYDGWINESIIKIHKNSSLENDEITYKKLNFPKRVTKIWWVGKTDFKYIYGETQYTTDIILYFLFCPIQDNKTLYLDKPILYLSEIQDLIEELIINGDDCWIVCNNLEVPTNTPQHTFSDPL